MTEILANSPVPGTFEPIGELAAELKTGEEGAKKLKLKATIAKNTGLRVTGEARVIIGSEIIRFKTETGEPTEYEILERKAEESIEANHPEKTKVYCVPTIGSMKAALGLINTKNVAMAYCPEKQKIPSGAVTKVKTTKVIKDPGSNFQASGAYKCPTEGYYHVDGQVALAGLNVPAEMLVYILVNGNEMLSGNRMIPGAGPEVNEATVSGIIFCKAGDEIALAIFDNGGEKELVVAETVNRLSVMLVGEGPEGKEGKTGPEGPAGKEGAVGPGQSWKAPVAYATTLALPTVTASGESLEASANGALEVDGGKPEVGQRILVKNQAEAKQDGIYEVIHAGGAAEKFKLTRTSGANTTALLQDAVCLAEKGAINKGHRFTQVATVTTVGTTAQEWREGEVLSVATEAGLASGTHNNWVPPNASVVVVTGSTEPIVTGMTGGEPGKIRVLRYAGTGKLVLSNESVASTAANRFAFPSKENLTLSPGFEILLIYVNERWTAQSAISGAKSIEGGAVSPAEVPTPEPSEGVSSLLSIGAKSPIGRLQVWSVTMTKGFGSTWKLNHNLENLATSIVAVWQGTAVAENGGEESKPEKQIITPSTVIKEVKSETNNRLVVTFVKEPVSGTEVFFLLVEG